jgi:hypothetical protein
VTFPRVGAIDLVPKVELGDQLRSATAVTR